MSYQFAAPLQSSDAWKPAEAVGHLLVITPTMVETDIETAYGSTDAVRCDVHDITGKKTWTQTLIFTGTLVGALKGRVGSNVLVRLEQGVPKPGRSAPYLLVDATGDPQAVADATAYLDALNRGRYTPPAAPAPAAPAPAPAPAPAFTPEVAAALAQLGIAPPTQNNGNIPF